MADGYDLHTCGSCKVEFNTIESFIYHKQESCQFLQPATGDNTTSEIILVVKPTHQTSNETALGQGNRIESQSSTVVNKPGVLQQIHQDQENLQTPQYDFHGIPQTIDQQSRYIVPQHTTAAQQVLQKYQTSPATKSVYNIEANPAVGQQVAVPEVHQSDFQTQSLKNELPLLPAVSHGRHASPVGVQLVSSHNQQQAFALRPGQVLRQTSPAKVRTVIHPAKQSPSASKLFFKAYQSSPTKIKLVPNVQQHLPTAIPFSNHGHSTVVCDVSPFPIKNEGQLLSSQINPVPTTVEDSDDDFSEPLEAVNEENDEVINRALHFLGETDSGRFFLPAKPAAKAKKVSVLKKVYPTSTVKQTVQLPLQPNAGELSGDYEIINQAVPFLRPAEDVSSSPSRHPFGLQKFAIDAFQEAQKLAETIDRPKHIRLPFKATQVELINQAVQFLDPTKYDSDSPTQQHPTTLVIEALQDSCIANEEAQSLDTTSRESGQENYAINQARPFLKSSGFIEDLSEESEIVLRMAKRLKQTFSSLSSGRQTDFVIEYIQKAIEAAKANHLHYQNTCLSSPATGIAAEINPDERMMNQAQQFLPPTDSNSSITSEYPRSCFTLPDKTSTKMPKDVAVKKVSLPLQSDLERSGNKTNEINNQALPFLRPIGCTSSALKHPDSLLTDREEEKLAKKLAYNKISVALSKVHTPPFFREQFDVLEMENFYRQKPDDIPMKVCSIPIDEDEEPKAAGEIGQMMNQALFYLKPPEPEIVKIEPRPIMPKKKPRRKFPKMKRPAPKSFVDPFDFKAQEAIVLAPLTGADNVNKAENLCPSADHEPAGNVTENVNSVVREDSKRQTGNGNPLLTRDKLRSHKQMQKRWKGVSEKDFKLRMEKRKHWKIINQASLHLNANGANRTPSEREIARLDEHAQPLLFPSRILFAETENETDRVSRDVKETVTVESRMFQGPGVMTSMESAMEPRSGDADPNDDTGMNVEVSNQANLYLTTSNGDYLNQDMDLSVAELTKLIEEHRQELEALKSKVDSSLKVDTSEGTRKSARKQAKAKVHHCPDCGSILELLNQGMDDSSYPDMGTTNNSYPTLLCKYCDKTISEEDLKPKKKYSDFKCDVCDKMCKEPTSWLKHITTHFGKKRLRYRCDLCGDMSYKKISSRNKHMKCCEKTIRKLKMLEPEKYVEFMKARSQKTVGEGERIQNNVVLPTMAIEDNLQEPNIESDNDSHESSIENDDDCPQLSKEIDDLKPTNKPVDLKCYVCGIMSKTVPSWLAHIKMHFGKKDLRFRCRFCDDRTFTTIRARNYHVVSCERKLWKLKTQKPDKYIELMKARRSQNIGRIQNNVVFPNIDNNDESKQPSIENGDNSISKQPNMENEDNSKQPSIENENNFK